MRTRLGSASSLRDLRIDAIALCLVLYQRIEIPRYKGLKELYRANQPSNSMSFFIGVEIYDHLEKVVDRFDDVANEIHGIVLENV